MALKTLKKTNGGVCSGSFLILLRQNKANVLMMKTPQSKMVRNMLVSFLL